MHLSYLSTVLKFLCTHDTVVILDFKNLYNILLLTKAWYKCKFISNLPWSMHIISLKIRKHRKKHIRNNIVKNKYWIIPCGGFCIYRCRFSRGYRWILSNLLKIYSSHSKNFHYYKWESNKINLIQSKMSVFSLKGSMM